MPAQPASRELELLDAQPCPDAGDFPDSGGADSCDSGDSGESH